MQTDNSGTQYKSNVCAGFIEEQMYNLSGVSFLNKPLKTTLMLIFTICNSLETAIALGMGKQASKILT